MEAYLRRFFPPRTLERRGEIIFFKQKEDESLGNAWEIFKQLLRRCPYAWDGEDDSNGHLYHAMNYTSKGTMDATSRGAFRRKHAKQVTQFIKDLAKSIYRAPSVPLGSSSRFR